MKCDQRHHPEPGINNRAFLKAVVIGALVVFVSWLGAAIFPLSSSAEFVAIAGGAIIAAVLSSFLAAKLCGLRRRNDGVACGISAWFVVVLFTGLALTPSVNAIDLKGLENSLFERLKIFITEAGAEDYVPMERAQLKSLIQRLGIAVDPVALAELESRASASDYIGTRAYLQTHLNLDPEKSAVIADHALTLYRDAGSAVAEQAVVRHNIKLAATTIWWLTLALLVSLLLSIWAGARGVRFSETRRV